MGIFEKGLMASYVNKEDYKKTEKSEWKREIRDLLDKNEKLTRFLEANRIKGEFIKECSNVDSCKKNRVRDALTNKYLFVTPINRAINWSDTAKGSYYWSEIDNKYSKFEKEK